MLPFNSPVIYADKENNDKVNMNKTIIISDKP